MPADTPRVDIRLLGPLAVEVDGDERAVNGAVRRSLLALLALHPGRVLDTQFLVEMVWHRGAPATAVNALRVHVSQLRRILGAGALIEYAGTGYRLNVAPDQVDACRFESLARAGRAHLRQGDVETAVARLRSAVALWRGPPLEDVTCEGVADEIRRLQQLYDEARVDLADAELGQAGTGADLTGLGALAAERPFDERVWALLIRAQYWTGRQADALATYRRATAVLADELGLEPGPGLRELERQILTQDPALDPPRPSSVELPAFATSFVGRGEQVEAVLALVAEQRLVTLTGLGGVGKTRLAVAVAAVAAAGGSGGYGAVFASFERLADPALVAEPLAEALGADQPTVAGVTAAVGDRELLVVLDNCEHLAKAVADLVVEVLRACPAVKILATSRIPLGVTGECAWAVPPLEVPSPDAGAVAEAGAGGLAEVLAVEAVALFVERARQARPSLALTPADRGDLVDVVRLLAGVPLGIELAAAQCHVLTVSDVARRLRATTGTSLSPERDRPERHHSMEAALVGSLQLLPAAARTLLARMTVFHEPVDLAAITHVCTGGAIGKDEVVDLLGVLVHAALVNADLAGPTATYWLLSPVREVTVPALTQLGEEPTLDAVAIRHAAHFADLAQDAARAVGGPDDLPALARVDTVLADVRAALEFAVAHDPVLAMRMVAALAPYWLRRRLNTEGRRWAARALASGQASSDRAAQAAALHAAGSLAFDDGDRMAAEEALVRALEIRRELGDRRAIGLTLNNLAGVASDSGDHARAYGRWLDALEIFVEVGHDLGVASTRTNLGIAAEKLGRHDDATEHLEVALAAARRLGNRHLEALALERMAIVSAAQGDHPRAKVLSRSAHEVYNEAGTPDQKWRSRWNLAMRHRALGEVDEARRHLAAAAQGVLDDALRDSWWVIGLLQTAAALAAPRDPARAARLLGLAEATRRSGGHDATQATIDDIAAVSRAVRDTLGESAWQGEFTVGAAQSLDALLPPPAGGGAEHLSQDH
jgi:predicted ATPase/DNA-binding SARP family transcriptional activator